MSDKKDSLTVDGVEYPLAAFSEAAQVMLGLHVDWSKDLKRAQSRVKQIEAALHTLNKDLNSQIEFEVKVIKNTPTTVNIDTAGGSFPVDVIKPWSGNGVRDRV